VILSNPPLIVCNSGSIMIIILIRLEPSSLTQNLWRQITAAGDANRNPASRGRMAKMHLD